MRALLFVIVVARTASADPRPARGDDLIDVHDAIADAVIDLRYATADNFTGAAVYPKATCKLRRAVVERLAEVAAALRAYDRRLVLWDCYRPKSIQKIFWKRVPDPRYVAPPKLGSRHSRGAAVDVALADRDGALLAMPTGFDDFTARAHRSRAQRAHFPEAARLDAAMIAAGFVGLATEWWHYDAPEADRYGLSDEPL
jgi:D-alanyl-D-alanine dipeptidase